MFSPRVMLVSTLLLAVMELTIWRVAYPDSFNRSFDPVSRGDLLLSPATIDLGELALRESRVLTIEVTNRKDRTVRLEPPLSTCGCLRFDLPEAVDLNPGETRELSVSYDAPAFPGDVRKSVVMRVASAVSDWKIPIQGRVVAEAWPSPVNQVVVLSEREGTAEGVIRFSTGHEVGHVLCSDDSVMAVEFGRSTTNLQTYKLTVKSGQGGEGFVSFLDRQSGTELANVPVRWRLPETMVCYPPTVVWDPARSDLSPARVIVLRDADETGELDIVASVPWVRVVAAEHSKGEVVRFAVEPVTERMPATFDGPVVRVVDASGRSIDLKGKM